MASVLDSARQGLVLLPRTPRETLRARGPDAKTWLNGLVTCDVLAVKEGRAAYGLLLSKQGKIQTDLEIVAVSDGLLFSVAPGQGQSTLEALERYLIMEDVELSEAPELSWWRVVGSPERTAPVSEQLRKVAREAASQSGLQQAYGVAHELDWMGLGGTLWLMAAEQQGAAQAAFSARPDLLAATPEQARFLRIACGFPEFNSDFGSDQNPHEASLDRRAVSWNKGCYLGQEVVCMQDMRGKVKRRLVILASVADARPAPGARVSQGPGAEDIGQVTSVASDSGQTLALARLKAPYFESTEPLHVEGAGSARIVAPAPRG